MRESYLYERIGTKPVIVGKNLNTAVTEEGIWDASQALTLFSAAVQLEVASTNAADAAAGTGARTVRVLGLDANYNVIEETLTLNGQTAVVSVNSYLRVFGVEVLTAGTGLMNAGIIYVADAVVTWTAGVPSDVTKIAAYITAGENISHNGHWTVPAGSFYLLTDVTFTNRSQVSEFRIYRRTQVGLWINDRAYALSNAQSLWNLYLEPLEIPEKSEIRFAVISAVAGAIATVEATFRRV
jgi:hypothetical protein